MCKSGHISTIFQRFKNRVEKIEDVNNPITIVFRFFCCHNEMLEAGCFMEEKDLLSSQF